MQTIYISFTVKFPGFLFSVQMCYRVCDVKIKPYQSNKWDEISSLAAASEAFLSCIKPPRSLSFYLEAIKPMDGIEKSWQHQFN